VGRYKKILITGSEGYLGKSLYNYLSKKKFFVKGISKSGSDIKLNLLDQKKTIKKLNEYKDYTLLHCAGYVPKNLKNYNDKKNITNVTITKNILKSKINNIYYISTLAIFSKDANITEKKVKITKIHNLYCKTKIKSENLFLNSKKKIKILRIPALFGGERKNGLIFNCIKNLKKRSKFKVINNYPLWVGIHIDDITKIIFEFISKKKINKSVVNFAYKKNYTLNQVIQMIFFYFKKKVKLGKGNAYKNINKFNYLSKVSFKKSLKKEIIKIKNNRYV
tara:strand:- start:24756 stop:25589 length:834 start_codon:yes stop_codon:yes gene_type:complete